MTVLNCDNQRLQRTAISIRVVAMACMVVVTQRGAMGEDRSSMDAPTTMVHSFHAQPFKWSA